MCSDLHIKKGQWLQLEPKGGEPGTTFLQKALGINNARYLIYSSRQGVGWMILQFTLQRFCRLPQLKKQTWVVEKE